MTRSLRVCPAAAALLLPLFFSHLSFGQVLYGDLVGFVSDPSNAPVANARVTTTNLETNQVRSTVSNEQGTYRFATLPGGRYEVRIEHTGFRAAVRRDLAVSINTVSRADFRLELAGVADSVQVTADTPLLQTDRAETRAEVNTKVLTDAPAPPGRNYQNLLITIPGFAPPESSNSIPSNPPRRSLLIATRSTPR